MTAKKTGPQKKAARNTTKKFKLNGSVRLDSCETVPDELELTAYAFDEAGKLVGTGSVKEEGDFSFAVAIARPADLEVVLAPKTDPDTVRRAASYSRKFAASDWKASASGATLSPSLRIATKYLNLWFPLRICVSGHVRNKVTNETGTSYCPVPFAKVEVFDVDREGCWWPYLYRVRELLKERRIVRAEDLLADQLQPLEPTSSTASLLASSVGSDRSFSTSVGDVDFDPQLDSLIGTQARSSELLGGERVGEVATLGDAEASLLEKVNITSLLAPWVLHPWCFFSRQKVCDDFTDCNGYFQCCFQWWPFHWRRGRLRFDLKPDIILRVTQIIDGVEKVIFMDPYSSTRWNSGSAHIDLFLDDEQVICGPGCSPDPDLGDCDATMLQLGRDEVWKIDKANGLYTALGETNGAYGHSLIVRGDFSPDFKDGSPARYYQLSYAEATGGGGLPPDASFTPIQTALEAYRASPGGVFNTYLLGPQPSGPVAGLYEVQDTAHWWIPKNFPVSTPGGTVLGIWPTGSFEADQGLYWLRMEVFDAAGSKLASADFCDYQGDGSGVPIPPVTSSGRLDLKVRIDNKAMTFDLVTPATNECGVVPWTPGLVLDFTVNADQANGRVHSWRLNFNKGTVPTELLVNQTIPAMPPPAGSRAVYQNGIASVSQPVSGANMDVASLTTTCAYGLHLYARSHVRVNYGWHNYGRKSYAIAVEKCPPCGEE